MTLSFAELGVSAELVRSLSASGITDPFPIQAATIADSLAGRDLLGRGRTGSGKTVAFSIPVVARLAASPVRTAARAPRALVLVPTRELASQVNATLEPLAAAAALRTAVVFGGVSQSPQVRALRDGCDVIVACPGRLEDLIAQGHCELGAVEVTVLDEADHMSELGFLPAVRRLLAATPPRSQRLLFSATLDAGIDQLAAEFLHRPAVHSVDPPAAQGTHMAHHVLGTSHEDKAAVVRELARSQGRTLLFTRTKHRARRLARQLTAAGTPAVDLHGNLSQSARERNLAAFSSGTARVLVATDIAARGIHVDDVALVVHVDVPADHKAYLHRSGRTARAGAVGTVVTLVVPEEVGELRSLLHKAGVSADAVRVQPGHPRIAELTGPTATLRYPSEAAAVVGDRWHRDDVPRPARVRRSRSAQRSS